MSATLILSNGRLCWKCLHSDFELLKHECSFFNLSPLEIASFGVEKEDVCIHTRWSICILTPVWRLSTLIIHSASNSFLLSNTFNLLLCYSLFLLLSLFFLIFLIVWSETSRSMEGTNSSFLTTELTDDHFKILIKGWLFIEVTKFALIELRTKYRARFFLLICFLYSAFIYWWNVRRSPHVVTIALFLLVIGGSHSEKVIIFIFKEVKITYLSWRVLVR